MGLCSTSTKSRERKACPCPSDTRNDAEGPFLSVTKSCNWRAGPRPFSTRNQACRTSSAWTRIACPRPIGTRNQAGGTSFVQYEKLRGRDFDRLVRKCAKGKLVLVYTLRGIKQVGHCLSSTRTCEWRACPRTSSMRNHASRNLSVWTKSQDEELVLVHPV